MGLLFTYLEEGVAYRKPGVPYRKLESSKLGSTISQLELLGEGKVLCPQGLDLVSGNNNHVYISQIL